MDSAKVEVPLTSEGRNDTAKLEARQMSTPCAFLFTPTSESDGYANSEIYCLHHRGRAALPGPCYE